MAARGRRVDGTACAEPSPVIVEFGAFALILAAASAVSVTVSVLMGILTDQGFGRRRIALVTVSFGTVASA